MLRKTRTK